MKQTPLQPTLCAEKYKFPVGLGGWRFAPGSGDIPIFPSLCRLLRDFERLRDCEISDLLPAYSVAAAWTWQMQRSVGVTSAEQIGRCGGG
jgi:hypothetical protein